MCSASSCLWQPSLAITTGTPYNPTHIRRRNADRYANADSGPGTDRNDTKPGSYADRYANADARPGTDRNGTTPGSYADRYANADTRPGTDRNDTKPGSYAYT